MSKPTDDLVYPAGTAEVPRKDALPTLSSTVYKAKPDRYESILSTLRRPGRKPDQPHLQTPPASVNKVRRPGLPNEITSLEHVIEAHGGTTSGSDLLPHRLKIQKKTKYTSPAQEIDDLKRQNGYLLAEVALLKETRTTLSGLQFKTQEAYQLLRLALQEVTKKLASSERRLMEYWGINPNDGSTEVRVF